MKNNKWIPAVLAIFSFLFLTGFWDGKSPQEQRKEIQQMRSRTLNDLYRIEPEAKNLIQKSTGYAVFSNVGVNLVLLSAAGGSGLAHNNHTGKDTYMNMASAGIGIGLGVKDFRGIFVFANQKVFDRFVTHGWQANAQVDAAAKSDQKGEAYSYAIDVAPGIKLYQFTENGLALQATIQGTKYWKDSDLN
ncbi:MAG: hypothetical protein P8Y20_11820 [Gammaproteobacteria bacterium]|jgi:lipid-binding SYLF domain-containing protein